MYKVIAAFRDKNDLKTIHKVGDVVNFDDKDRIADLLKRGLIEESPSNDLNSFTKAELMQKLEEKNIQFDKKATKADLISLLGGD